MFVAVIYPFLEECAVDTYENNQNNCKRIQKVSYIMTDYFKPLYADNEFLII
jgi:hypothetical protein